ncbi:MAG: BatA domain-containing protein [Gemmatimonadota bacterium]|jgi:hypothetical protein
MPLRFLVPAFLLGIAAVAIPILVHLTRRQRAKVVEFPSLMFLERVPFRAESKRRIHHWLLLLFRALAVALVVAAFARPLLTNSGGDALAGTGPRELVILLDRSYSMGIGNRWEDALDAIRGAVQDLGPLDRASLAVFGRNAGALVRSTSDASRLLATLDTLEPGNESTSYGPGLKLAQTILEESELPARELVLVGDFQRTGWTGEEGVHLPSGTVVTPIVVGEEVPPNQAIARVTLPRQRLDGRDRVTPAARLTRTGGEAEDTVEVILELEGREVQRQAVVLPANGATGVIFEPFNLSQDFTRGTVRFAEADELAPDDEHHFVMSPGRTISVLILDDGARGAASSLFMTEALAISEESLFGVTVQARGTVTAAELREVSVVVVNDRSIPAGNTAEALRGFVEEGGGLLVVTGERIRWPGELADLLPGGITPPVESSDNRAGRLGFLDYDHPVFEIFRGPRSGDFTGARFFRHRTVQMADGRVLARYDDGSVALAEKIVGDGTVLVWTSTLDAFWNDLAQQPVFLPFMHQLIKYASGRSETVASFTAGQVLDVSDAAAMAAAGLGEIAEDLAGSEDRVAFTPSGESFEIPAGEGPRFLRLEERGVYDIRTPGDSDMRSVAVAVNVDLAEADLHQLDVEMVTASLVARTDSASPPMEGIQAARLRMEDQERRQSLWRFLLLMALLLLALETVISNRISGTAGGRGYYAGS